MVNPAENTYVSAAAIGTELPLSGVADALVGTVAEQPGVGGPHTPVGVGRSIVLDDAEKRGIGGFAVERSAENETAPPVTVETWVVRGGAGAGFVDRQALCSGVIGCGHARRGHDGEGGDGKERGRSPRAAGREKLTHAASVSSTGRRGLEIA